ncbi:MAG TPA: hypothetical protein PK752_15055 [Accumulibacter sp.]|uniref:hypothetical protein n=1 Tax=Accumulibacter sp. TaxID=2053492 RepID=UPI002CFA0041|nr:hypothetical protein [Accumulibacter sp.]HRD89555.1 hypothetical protein [Accumulibacter sp.]
MMMKKTIGALLLVLAWQPVTTLADGRGYGAASVSGGAVVVGGRGGYYGPRGGYYGPRGGYYGPPGGYYGPRWRPYGPSVGFYFGATPGWGWPWGPPVYYPPPVLYPPVVTVPPPVVYVERGADATPLEQDAGQALEPGYWYYCRANGGYYPAVMQCPGPWEKVVPRDD